MGDPVEMMGSVRLNKMKALEILGEQKIIASQTGSHKSIAGTDTGLTGPPPPTPTPHIAMCTLRGTSCKGTPHWIATFHL